jgi:hypothetical protein
MSGVLRSLATVVLVLVPATPALQAQGAEFSFGGGVGIPLGTYDDVVKMGWHGIGAVSFVPRSLPFGIQVDGTYAQFSDETPLDIKSQLIYGTANAVYKFQTSESTRFRPYLIGGAGVYNSKANGSDAPDGSTTKPGINLGAGFDFKAGSAGVFLEGRWHNVFLEGDNLKFLPITLGIRFGGN